MSLMLSLQQTQALHTITEWFPKRDKPFFYLAGYAGTGKTTLAKEVADAIGSTIFVAFTGKAVNVLREKGCRNVSTIDSLIYHPKFRTFCARKIDPCKDHETECPYDKFCPDLRRIFIGRALKEESDMSHAGLVIVDEVSMVDERMGRDLLSFRVPVLVLGDPAQLPPVSNSAGFFTRNQPDFLLSDIQRQALNSPVIQLATQVREGKELSLGRYGESAVVRGLNEKEQLDFDQVIVGSNTTRRYLNYSIRKLLGYDNPIPEKGERLVCTQNAPDKKFYNGTQWRVMDIGKPRSHTVELLLRDEARDFIEVNVPLVCFDMFKETPPGLTGDLFTFAYAITCHKAQGSEWDSVLVFNESGLFRENYMKWLYTAITRASKRVTITSV